MSQSKLPSSECSECEKQLKHLCSDCSEHTGDSHQTIMVSPLIVVMISEINKYSAGSPVNGVLHH